MSSLRQQLSWKLAVIVGLAWLLASLAIYFTARQLLVAEFDASLDAKADALIAASEVDDGEFEVDMELQSFAGFGSPYGGDLFQIRDAQGATLIKSPSLGAHELPASPYPMAAAKAAPHLDMQLPDGRPGRIAWRTFAPSDDDENRFTPLMLTVVSEGSSLRTTLQTLGWVLAVGGVVAMLGTLGLLLMALRSGLRPLSRMAKQVQAIKVSAGGSDGGQRLPVPEKLPVELREIATKLNELLARVEETLQRERRFSSHAAHELRTPLAELRAMTELTAMSPEEEATPERLSEMLATIQELEDLVAKLSLLSRADAAGGEGARSIQRQCVVLKESASSVLDRWKEKAEFRGITLQAVHETPDGGSSAIHTDPTLWQAILQNLIGNAVSHAPEGTLVRVRVLESGVEVSNKAPHLTQEELPKLFERFWHKPGLAMGPAADEREERHSGLGLSIVKASAEALGMQVSARLNESGDLKMIVKW